ncbi:MAG: VOC family protein [Planctomycetota bacterium]
MKLGYVILYVPDVPKAVEFYKSAFGLECRFQPKGEDVDYAEMATGETVLSFASETLAQSHGFRFRKSSIDEDAASVELALVTDDVDTAFHRAVTAGAQSAKEPSMTSWGQTVSYVRDLNGYLVEICSPIQSGES